MMTSQEAVMQALQKMGYKPNIDEDNDIHLWYQMKHIYFLIEDEDNDYVTVHLPSIYTVKDEKEVPLLLATCNQLTRDLKLCKVFLSSDFKTVSASNEFLYCSEESLEQNIRYSLSILGIIRRTFRVHLDKMRS